MRIPRQDHCPECLLFAGIDLDEDADGAGDVSTSGKQANGTLPSTSFFIQKAEESSYDYAKRVFKRVFCEDIQRVGVLKVCAMPPQFLQKGPDS